MATITEIAAYYVARLASIYRTKPNASREVALLAKQMLADNFVSELNTAFDLDLATGVQLDTIGKYVGAPRDVGVEDERPFFGFVTYDYPAGTQNENGFVLYASLSTNANGVWLEYEFTNQSTTQLPDYSYRQLLKLKILTNISDNTMNSLQNQIATFFNGQLQVRDNLDMSMTYFFGSSFQLPLSVLTAYLPRPMGVMVNAIEAIGFDVYVDSVPTFTSETPDPEIDFGTIQFSDSKLIEIVNAKTSSFNIIAITSSNPVFTIESVTPSLPATLGQGDNLSFILKAESSNPATDIEAIISVFITSTAGLTQFDIGVKVTVEGIELTWMAFDNLSGYADGSISSLNDSWGWLLSGTFTTDPLILPRDNLGSYADGTISELDGGSNWAENGEFIT